MIKKLEDIDIDDRCYVATYFMGVYRQHSNRQAQSAEVY